MKDVLRGEGLFAQSVAVERDMYNSKFKTAKVSFSSEREALEAFEKFDGKTLEDNVIFASVYAYRV